MGFLSSRFLKRRSSQPRQHGRSGAGRFRNLSRRRPLRFEFLEERRLLQGGPIAGVNWKIAMYSDAAETQPITYATVGQTFYLSVLVEDSRATPTAAAPGIISLPLNLDWNPSVIQYADTPPLIYPNNIPANNPIVTSNFPSQRFVTAFPNQLDSTNGTVSELRGGTIPSLDGGNAIGTAGFQEFSQFHFKAVGAADAMPFGITIDQSMSFADGAEFTGLTGSGTVRVLTPVSGTKTEYPTGTPLAGWTMEAFHNLDGDVAANANLPLTQAEVSTGPFDATGAVSAATTPSTSGNSTSFSATVDGDFAVGDWIRFTGNATATAGQIVQITGVSSGVYTVSPALNPLPSPPSSAAPSSGDMFHRLNGSVSNATTPGKTMFSTTLFPSGYLGVGDWVQFAGNMNAAIKNEQAQITSINGNQYTVAGLSNAPHVGDMFARIQIAQTVVATGAYSILLDTGASSTGISGTPANYIVAEVMQPNWVEKTPTTPVFVNANSFAPGGYAVTIGVGTKEQTSKDFQNAITQHGTVQGRKFNDLNKTGTDLPTYAGLSNWTIEAFADTNGDGLLNPGEYNNNASPAAVASTDSNGQYTLWLNPGQYIIVEVRQSAYWEQSYPSTSVLDPSLPPNPLGPYGYVITVQSGQTYNGNDFGNWKYGQVTGRKFYDLNKTGTDLPTYPGLSNWTIEAFVDTNGDGLLNPGEYNNNASPAAVASTDSNGQYTLWLNPGRYVIVEVRQSAYWEQSYPSTSVLDPSLPPNPLGPYGYVITVQSGQTYNGNDFGNWKYGQVTGRKFDDLNKSGTDLPTYPGLSNWTIEAFADTNGDGLLNPGEYNNNASPAAVASTDSNGQYTLWLNPGRYVIVEVRQSAYWEQSYPSTSVLDPSLPPNPLGPYGYVITVQSGQTYNGNDFGNWPTTIPATNGSLSGFVYDDANQNGTYDRGSAVPTNNEFGLPNVTLTLSSSNGTLQTTTSGSDGFYDFEGLAPGTYQVSMGSPPASFRVTQVSPGRVLPLDVQTSATTSDGQVGANNSIVNISLAAGDGGVNYNFGLLPTNITKRMFLAGSTVRQELDAELGVTAATVSANSGDTISAVVSNQLVTVTTVSASGAANTQYYALTQASVVLIDASGTKNPVTLTDLRADSLASSWTAPAPATAGSLDVAVRVAGVPLTSNSAVEVCNAQQVNLSSVAGNGGLAVLGDSSASDNLTAGASAATLRDNSSLVTPVTGFDTVRAFSINGGSDSVTKNLPIDYVLESYGNWNP